MIDDGRLSNNPRERTETVVPGDAAPVTFGVHDEGEGLFALYMTPSDASDLARGLERLKINELWNVTAAWGRQTAHAVSRTALASSRGALDLVHSPSREPEVDAEPMIAHPHEVLPEGGDGLLAYSLSHDGHGVVFSRDPKILATIIASYLESRIVLPGRKRFPKEITQALAEPIPDELWIEATVKTHKGRRILNLATVGVDAWHRMHCVHDIRWILENAQNLPVQGSAAH